MQSTGDNVLHVPLARISTSPSSCLVMLKQMDSGYAPSVLSGLGQVSEPCQASITYLACGSSCLCCIHTAYSMQGGMVVIPADG